MFGFEEEEGSPPEASDTTWWILGDLQGAQVYHAFHKHGIFRERILTNASWRGERRTPRSLSKEVEGPMPVEAIRSSLPCSAHRSPKRSGMHVTERNVKDLRVLLAKVLECFDRSQDETKDSLGRGWRVFHSDLPSRSVAIDLDMARLVVDVVLLVWWGLWSGPNL